MEKGRKTGGETGKERQVEEPENKWQHSGKVG